MKKKIVIISMMIIIIFTLTACNKQETENKDAIKFKEEYESLNGKTNSNDRVYRSVYIDEDNPFIYLTPEELIEKMNSGETFYVYFGSKLCPWCRSVIEKAIEVAKEKGISKIYYIDIWDNDGNEILRDKYILDDDNNPVQSIQGTDTYYEIIKKLDYVLSDYTLNDENGNEIDVGEKRIYAPNFIYIKNGQALAITEGTSSLQTDSRETLTEEILKDEEELLSKFFEEDCNC